MSTITAKTTNSSLWKDQISFTIDNSMGAGSGDVREHRGAEVFIPSIRSVNPFSVVGSIVEHLSIDGVFGVIDDISFIKGYFEGICQDGCIPPQGHSQQQDQNNGFHQQNYYLQLTTINEHMSRENCASCHNVPQDILILECEHNMCLGCAFTVLKVETKTIRCKLCSTPTQVDEEIIRHLVRSWTKTQKQTHKEQLCRGQSAKSILYSDRNERKGQSKPYCHIHHELELMYMCYQCDCALICPQCVIHGHHQGHKVTTIRNYLHLKAKQLEDQSKDIDSQTNKLQIERKELERQFIGRCQEIQELKRCAVQKYKLLHENLVREEQLILKECESLLKCYSRDYENMELMVIEELDQLSMQKHEIGEIVMPIYKKSLQLEKQLKLISRLLSYEEGKKSRKSRMPSCESYSSEVQQLTARVEEIPEELPYPNRMALRQKHLNKEQTVPLTLMKTQNSSKLAASHNADFFIF